MPQPFDGYEVGAELRPAAQDYGFDLDRALASVVALEATIPPDALSAASLGAQRLGNGIVIGADGLVLTMSYLVMEAQTVVLTRNDGGEIPAHVLGVDPVTGFGVVQALDPLGLPALPLGDSKGLQAATPVIIAGAGGRSHAAAGLVLARAPFAGYWEYFLDNAIITAPAHPHWSGAALIGASGELVGVGSLSLQGQTRQGGARPINMFVPIDLLPPILDDLVRGKPAHPPRPWLGLLAQEMGRNVVLLGVSPGGPAARAELRAGDVVRAIAGEPVEDLADFYRKLWALGPAGALVPLRLQREADTFDVEVRSADRAATMRKPKLN